MDEYLLGFDIGSSSVKASLVSIATGTVVASAASPSTELPIDSPHPGWAEQHPDLWWEHLVKASARLKQKADLLAVRAVGLSYQMHGLVIVDKNNRPLRPSIIWCDSRAVSIGAKAFRDLGSETALPHLLNSPGNFTASKLRWVMENEPGIYDRIDAFMLPGDYAALKLTGHRATTMSGLSEGILWDFTSHGVASLLLDLYEIDRDLVPEITDTFGIQGELTPAAAQELGLKKGIPVSYRSGDQPNNAFSLTVLKPGEIAATAGTSGVVYGVFDSPRFDPKSRVNTFVHVNHTPANPRCGVLLCINGTGILNSWLKQLISMTEQGDYTAMNREAAAAPIGADGLVVFPYGNGAERTLNNRDPGAAVQGLQFTRHGRPHLLRAAQEGIVFALEYGLEIMREMGMKAHCVRAGHANMFLSPLFREAFSAVTGATVELFNTDGAAGAARGAGIGCGMYSFDNAFDGLKAIETVVPDPALVPRYRDAYGVWKQALEKKLA